MGAPNYRSVKLKQSGKAEKPGKTDNTSDKLLIEQYKEKIANLVQDPKQAKKMAEIISGLINSKK